MSGASASDAAPPDFGAAAKLLYALAHTTRLALLSALIDGERSVSEIEQATGIGQPGLSQQLGVLRKAALVGTRREAKQIFYSLDRRRIAEIGKFIAGFDAPVEIATDAFVKSPAAVSATGGGAAMFARIVPRAGTATHNAID